MIEMGWEQCEFRIDRGKLVLFIPIENITFLYFC